MISYMLLKKLVTCFERSLNSFRELLNIFKKETSHAQLPSAEEMAVLRQRWSGLLKDLEPLDDDLFAEIRAELTSSPDLLEARAHADFWKRYGMKSPPTSASKDTTSRQKTPKAIMDVNAQSAEASSPSTRPGGKRSFFRSFFRHILSFFSIRF
ncbi:hypothetical protein AN958_03757 [Leucoagaricus sp. SymC.cos]|nr:hypothetical protein AN958_03757 [Leucoagaricus sp. SymC.cos]